MRDFGNLLLTMENSTPLTETVNELLKHGYRCQASAPDLAVLTHRTIGQVLTVTTVSGDGKIKVLPLSELLETLLNG